MSRSAESSSRVHVLQRNLVAFGSEFVGTTMFLFLGLGGIRTAIASQSIRETEGLYVSIDNVTILFIATSMGLALLVSCWSFYRVTGAAFNPAISLALFLIGAIPAGRAVFLIVAQILGGIAGAALVSGLTLGGVASTTTSLQPGFSAVRGLFLEAMMTAMLVFVVLMLAAEKHKATYLAPVAIGLTQFSIQLIGTLWDGCGANPARAFGPSVVSGVFPSEHWIYWVGPLLGTFFAVFFYVLLKAFSYENVVIGQDSEKPAADSINFRKLFFGHGAHYQHRESHHHPPSALSNKDVPTSNGDKNFDLERNDLPLTMPPMVDGVLPSGRNDPAN